MLSSVHHEYMAKAQLLEVSGKGWLWLPLRPRFDLLEHKGIDARARSCPRVEAAEDRFVVDGLQRE